MSRRLAYRRMFTRAGRRVTISRKVANSEPVTLENVRARIRGAQPDEVAGGISTRERRVLILAEDVPADFGLQDNDRIIVDGGRLTITNVDRHTHRDGEVLLAYDCIASGG
ncbi:hypothetical protein [Antarcticirhabdus aurantiaca]|uniref:Uncharacterized protein n=1 Tax=Antarcticirhabdus aurantiaca TaxID=2606717 RepID=A0ACD4NQW2_9HYPH|nr:hypothetical protein OXU80_03560 [Jeongeuplla avenae]